MRGVGAGLELGLDDLAVAAGGGLHQGGVADRAGTAAARRAVGRQQAQRGQIAQCRRAWPSTDRPWHRRYRGRPASVSEGPETRASMFAQWAAVSHIWQAGEVP